MHPRHAGAQAAPELQRTDDEGDGTPRDVHVERRLDEHATVGVVARDPDAVLGELREGCREVRDCGVGRDREGGQKYPGPADA